MENSQCHLLPPEKGRNIVKDTPPGTLRKRTGDGHRNAVGKLHRDDLRIVRGKWWPHHSFAFNFVGKELLHQ